MDLILADEPNISSIADHVYHCHKSLGVTYTSTRSAIQLLPLQSQQQAVRVLLSVIKELNSPTMFIEEDI